MCMFRMKFKEMNNKIKIYDNLLFSLQLLLIGGFFLIVWYHLGIIVAEKYDIDYAIAANSSDLLDETRTTALQEIIEYKSVLSRFKSTLNYLIIADIIALLLVSVLRFRNKGKKINKKHLLVILSMVGVIIILLGISICVRYKYYSVF